MANRFKCLKSDDQDDQYKSKKNIINFALVQIINIIHHKQIIDGKILNQIMILLLHKKTCFIEKTTTLINTTIEKTITDLTNTTTIKKVSKT